MIVWALWGMARPLIVVSVVLVYASGILMARAEGVPLDLEAIIWSLLILLLATLSIHYTNEYADYETDAITQPTLYSGGSGVLPGGKVPRRLALQAAWVTLLMSVALAGIGWWQGIFPALAFVILLVGTFFGWMYSLPPLKLAWRGWGELDNAILGGALLHWYGYATLTNRLDVPIIAAVFPFTLLVFTNLLATTWADRTADAHVGKYTLATQWTIKRLKQLYASVALVAFLSLPFLLHWSLPPQVVIGSLPAIPMMIWGWRTYTRLHNPYPTSNAMVVLLLGQMIGWYWAGS